MVKLLGTYIDKMPGVAGPDNRIHCSFKSIGAATGRMASESPNMQNIPSKLHDIRHMFRATPEITELMEVDDDNMIVLSDIDRIEVKGKGLTYVKDLVVGDVVTMSDGQETCEFKIADLELIEESACYKIELEQIFN